MPDETRGPDSDDSLVYEVRPEPPQFKELIRQPARWGGDSMLRPPGPFRRWLGARRARFLFRAGLVAMLGFAAAVIVL